jgi:beta-lactam-binding protein with PASTA domain
VLVQDHRVVPDLYGLSVTDANRTLENLRLRSNVVPDPGNEMMCVIAQSPAPGTQVTVGATITIQMAAQCPKVGVPDLEGMTQADAQARVGGLGLKLGKARYVDADQAAGKVVGQNPSPGTSVKPGTGVDVDLSQGPPATATPRPESQVTKVPNLIGMPAEKAKGVAAKYQLTMSTTGSEASAKPTGTVISQQPVPGTQVMKHSQVSVVVAAPFLVVPNVIGMSQVEAGSALTNAGFSLGAVTHHPSHATPGKVIAQEPPAGTQFVHGAPVEIVLAADVNVEVPSLQGLRLGPAKSRLKGRGLALGHFSPLDIDTARAIVQQQSPKAHQWVAPGTAVDLVFAWEEVLAQVWTADSTAVTGDSLTVGVDVTPKGAGTAYRFGFGDGQYSPWTALSRAKHSYQHPGSFLVGAAVRLQGGRVVLARAAPVLVTRKLTPILTFTVIAGFLGLPLVWKLIQKLPIPALHVRLVPEIGRAATVAATLGDQPSWNLAIVSPGEIERCTLDPPGLTATPRRSP